MNYRRSQRVKRKKPKTKKILFLFFLFFAFSFLLYFLFFSNFFTFKEIIVSGNAKIPQEEVLKKIQKEVDSKKFYIINNNLLLFNLEGVENDILANFPLASNVKIIKKYPNTINVLVDERVGAAIFCNFSENETSENCYVIDWQGIVFESFLLEDQLLPKINNVNLQEELVLGNKVIGEELLVTILRFYLDMERLGIQLDEFLIIADNRINIVTNDGWEVYFNPAEDIEWQLTKLNAVLNEGISLEERVDLEYIELRFGNTAPFKMRD